MLLDALKEASTGKKVALPEAPLVYTLLKYRQKMGITYWELRNTPMDVIMTDLEMLDLEAEYGPNGSSE